MIYYCDLYLSTSTSFLDNYFNIMIYHLQEEKQLLVQAHQLRAPVLKIENFLAPVYRFVYCAK